MKLQVSQSAKKKVVKRDKAQDEEMAKFSKFAVIDFFLTERINISVYGHKQPVANLSVVDFRYQLRKHTIAQVKYVTFNFSTRIQFYFRFQEILKAIVRKKYEFFCVFSSHNPRKSRQATLD